MATSIQGGDDEARLRRAREAKARFGRELMAHPDVHGVGIGHRRVRDRKTDEVALVVHVHRKRPKSELEPSRILPSEFRFYSQAEKREVSVRVDVRERPAPIPEVACGDCTEDLAARRRPVPGGVSGGLADAAGGTLGGWVWDRESADLVLLSNEHVLGSTAGATVIQPSIGDGGSSPDDDIGSVVRAGSLDAAIAEVTDSADIDNEILCSGPAVFETADAILGMEVEKVGQTTGLTCGLVDLVDYDSGHYGSRNDLWIDGDGSNFSSGGDSGSLYVERNHPDGSSWKRIVGIHWGGSGNDGVGHPIGAVFSDLNLTTVCAGVVEAILDAIFAPEAEREVVRARRAALTSAKGRPDAVLRPLAPTIALPGSIAVARLRPAGFARTFEKRMADTRAGGDLVERVRRARVEVVRLLLDGDGWRAAVAALQPLSRGTVTTDDLLGRVVGDEDVKNFQRLISVGRRLAPHLAAELSLAEHLLARTKGHRVAEMLEQDLR